MICGHKIMDADLGGPDMGRIMGRRLMYGARG